MITIAEILMVHGVLDMNNSYTFGSLLIFLGVATTACFAIEVDEFDSIRRFTLRNQSGMTVQVTNYGAMITSIIVPDRDGKMKDVALGYDQLEKYINAIEKPYFGSVVGRVGNRIAKGKFELDGKSYSLKINNGPNHLHGGLIGFDKVVWEAKVLDTKNAVELTYVARDGEEGYPGNLTCKVTYQLTESNEIVVEYHATTDQATPVNLTQHTYFNLRGEGDGTVEGHEIMIPAKQFTPVDQTLIPTGELRDVAGTPFDFTVAKSIGKDIEQDDEQLNYGGGWDHNWVLDRSGVADGETALAARVYEPTSGRVMEVFTTEPGVQFYCGNFLSGALIGKSGKPYIKRGGFCLETQHYPDSPNQPEFPSCILRPGEEYQSTTIFKFSTR